MNNETQAIQYYSGLIYEDKHSKTFDVFVGGWSVEVETLEEAKKYIREFLGISK